MRDLSLTEADAPRRADWYRNKAEEIRRAARVANSADVAGDLLETALRFDRMAVYAEKSLWRCPFNRGLADEARSLFDSGARCFSRSRPSPSGVENSRSHLSQL